MTITKLKEAYKEMCDLLEKEGWPRTILDKAADNLVEQAKCSIAVDFIEDENNNIEPLSIKGFKEYTAKLTEELEEDEKLRKKTVESAKMLERKLMEEEAREKDFESPIKYFLTNYYHVSAVSAREVADEYFLLLSDEKKDYYLNNPLLAAYKNLKSEEFHDALTTCIKKYNNSIVMRDKINSYLNRVNPERDPKRDEEEIDSLIQLLPAERKDMDDRYYQAYTAICWLEDSVNKDKEPMTQDDIKFNPDVNFEFTASMASNINSSEPYEVSYRNSFEKAIGVLAKNCGKVKAFPTHLADVAGKSLDLGERETLGDNLYKKVKENAEIERLFREKEEEKLKIEQELAKTKAKLEKIENSSTQQTSQQQQVQRAPQQDVRPPRFYERRYNNNYEYGRTYGYSDNYYRRPQTLQTKLIGICVNLGVLALFIMLDKLLKIGLIIPDAGLIIATIGWLRLPNHQSTYNRNYQKSNWLAWLIGGYSTVIVGLALILMF